LLLFILMMCVFLLSLITLVLGDDTYYPSFDLAGDAFSGSFSGYYAVSITMSTYPTNSLYADSVDFWISTEDQYDTWINTDQPSTVDMFASTYVNDKQYFNITFNVPSGSTTYKYVISGIYPTSYVHGTAYITFYGSGSFSEATTIFNPTCFAPSSLLTLESGKQQTINNIKIGDKVQAVNGRGEIVFSPVIYLPHQSNKRPTELIVIDCNEVTIEEDYNDNNMTSSFIKMSSIPSLSLQVTPNHLIFICVPTANSNNLSNDNDNNHGGACAVCDDPFHKKSLIQSRHVTPGMCLANVIIDAKECSTSLSSSPSSSVHWKPVRSVTASSGRGVYSLVTLEPFVVVDGIVASPFDKNHAIPNAFYHLHRAAYHMGLYQYDIVQLVLRVVTNFAELVVSSTTILHMHDIFISYMPK
jgi:hypothetical protein